MKTRIVLITAILVAGFVFITSRAQWNFRTLLQPVADAGGHLWSGPPTAHTAGLTPDEINNIDVYKVGRQATVYITSTVYRQNWFLQTYPENYVGSGFIIHPDGEILTNYHVISGSNQVEVRLPDQSSYKAQVLVRDRVDDLALIRIDAHHKLPFLSLGDSDRLQVGQKVLAIGNPFGLFDLTLTTGVVSALGRNIQGGANNQVMEGMIQTDAAINSGNSGGPLLDSQGDVIGINTAIYGPNGGNVGIGFALPINRAKTMLDDFQAGRSFKRARLGIDVVYVAGDLAEALDLPRQGGLLVQDVAPGSPAEAAGIRPANRAVIVGNTQVGIGGDFILAIDGKPANRPDAVMQAVARKHPGDILGLRIYRNGHTIDLRVKLGEAPDQL
jgi:S1-C subfamily serine protease